MSHVCCTTSDCAMGSRLNRIRLQRDSAVMATVRKRTWKSGGEVKTAWICDYIDQNGKRHIKTFSRQRDARDWLDQTTGEVREGIHTPERQSITVAEARSCGSKTPNSTSGKNRRSGNTAITSTCTSRRA